MALLGERAPVLVWTLGPDEGVTQLAGGLLDRFGYRPADWVGRPLGARLADRTALRLARAALAGESGTDLTSVDGSEWRVSADPLRAGSGEVTGAVLLLSVDPHAPARRDRAPGVHASLPEKLAALVEMSDDFVAVADLDGTVTYVNRYGRELVGLGTDAEAVGRPTDDYFTDISRELSREIEESVREQGSWSGTSLLRHFDGGDPIPVRISSFLVRGLDGTPLALATVQRDLRTHRQAEQAMAVRVQEQRALAELGRQALTLSLEDLLRVAVQLMAARYPTQSAAVLCRRDDMAEMVASSVAGWRVVRVPLDETSLTGRAILGNRVVFSGDLADDPRFPDAPATRFGQRSALCCPIPGDDAPWGAVCCSSEETRRWTDDDVAFVESLTATIGAAVRREVLEDRLQHQALHDSLTGLPNRALVLDRIEHALGLAAREGSTTAVLLLDLDGFKDVNDTLGHGSGDTLLTDLAHRLGAVVRDGDTVARLGGDEFVVVCEDIDAKGAAFIAKALLDCCARGVELAGRRLSPTASVGVALCHGGQSTTSSLLSEADIAMYRAKRDRPGGYRIFDEAMRGDVLGRVNVAGELRAAVRAEAIDVAYQPIVELASGRVVAMEALARWTSDTGEQVPPDLFVPVAEETGIIGELGRLMLRKAIRSAASWQDLGPVGVRVNASAHELRTHEYVDHLLDTLAAARFPAELLGLEITESVFVDDDRTTQDNLSRLRAGGISLLIDDFGTGYSSLSYLQRFPVVDVLKVDRSFLGEGTRGEAVVQAVVGLGRAFGLRVCAEGVETAEQLARVTELGCDFAQGYLLGRPLPAEQARGLLRDWSAAPTRR